MKALILAGGLGTRLKTIVPHLPKPLAQVDKRPFLEYLMDYWIEKDIKAFYLSTCHLAEKIKDHFQNEYKGCPIHYIEEPKPLGTGGAILYSLDLFQDKEEDWLVLNGDTFTEVNFELMDSFHREKNSSLTIALREVTENDRYSGVSLNEDSKIIDFKKREQNSSTLLINSGVYLLKPKIFSNLKWISGDVFSIEDDFFPEIIQKNSVYGFVTKGKFIDIGIPKDYELAQSFFSYAK